MQEKLDSLFTKNPDKRLMTIVAGILVLLLLGCLCLLCATVWRPKNLPVAGAAITATPFLPVTPTVTFTLAPSPTITVTLTSTITGTITTTVTNTPAPTSTLTPPNTLTPAPTYTFVPTFTIQPTYTIPPTITPTITITPTNTEIPTITVTPTNTNTPNPLSGPEYVAVYEETGNVWVTSANNNSLVELTGDTLQPVSNSRLSVDSPNGIAIWQARGLAYVTNKNKNTVTEINLANHSVNQTINVGMSPMGVTVEQSTGTVFVANYADNTISCILPDRSKVYSSRNGVFYRPSKLAPYLYTHYITGANQTDPAAFVIDSEGHFSLVYSSGNLCQVDYNFTVSNAFLADITAILRYQSTEFFITDSVNNMLWSAAQYATPGPSNYKLPNPPFAIANLDACVGVVVPEENRLYIFNTATGVQLQYWVGEQGDNGGHGLAFSQNNKVVYVTNWGANSVSRIALSTDTCVDPGPQ